MSSIITQMSTSQLAALTTAQIAALTSSDVAALSTAQIIALSPAQIAALSTAGVSALSGTQVTAMTSAEVAALTTAQIPLLPTAAVAALTSAQVAAMSTAEVAALTAADVGALGTAQIAALKGSQLAAMTTANIATLSATQIPALSTAALASLSTAQVAALPTADIAALSTAQIAAMTGTQIAALTAAQFGALSPVAIGRADHCRNCRTDFRPGGCLDRCRSRGADHGPGRRPIDGWHCRPDLAITLYRTWLAHTNSPLAHAVSFNLGVALNNAKEFTAAEQAYRRTLELNPAFIPAHLNLGTLLEHLGRFDEALAQWRAILRLDEAALAADRTLHLQALNNLARLLEIMRQFQEAESLLEQSLALDANQPHALQHWVHLRQKQCEWPVYRALNGISGQQMREATSALSALSAFDDPAMQLAAARRFVANKVHIQAASLADCSGYAHRKLRIAYLSSDFCLHPVSLLTVELFELHDRDKFEIYGFCWSRDDGSALRKRVMGAFDHYVRITDMSDEAAAQCIRAHEIDILGTCTE